MERILPIHIKISSTLIKDRFKWDVPFTLRQFAVNAIKGQAKFPLMAKPEAAGFEFTNFGLVVKSGG
jgi:hypothetical protein